MSANPQVLDAAVRAFQRKYPERGYCVCFGCVVTINGAYRALMAELRTESPDPVSSLRMVKEEGHPLPRAEGSACGATEGPCKSEGGAS